MTDEGTRPLLRVVRGDATVEEIAALLAALATTRATARARAHRGPADGLAGSGWCDRSRMLRAPMPHGPGAWRASALPR